MNYAYVRVSTEQQTVQNQKYAVLEFCNREGMKIDQWLEISMSSRKTTKERRIDELLSIVNAGDCIIVSELSRLGRSTGQVIQIIEGLSAKSVSFISLKENINVISGKEIDPFTKMFITFIATFSELDRNLISMRTKEALAARKASGMKLGRPEGKGKSKLDQYDAEIQAFLNNGSTKTWIAKRYGVSLSNLHHWLNRRSEYFDKLSNQ